MYTALLPQGYASPQAVFLLNFILFRDFTVAATIQRHSSMDQILDQISPYIDEAGKLIKPHFNTLRKTVVGSLNSINIPPALLEAQSLVLLNWTLFTDLLPPFDEYSPKLVAISAIVLHVLFYNFIARLEYNTKLFTRVFSGLAVYLNALLLIVSALIRDHYVIKVILADAGSVFSV